MNSFPARRFQDTAGPQITSFLSRSSHLVSSFCFNVDEKMIAGWGRCLCGVCTFSPCLRGFSLGTLVPPVRCTGVSYCPSLSERGGGGVSAPCAERALHPELSG